jgi:hypothetical protein
MSSTPIADITSVQDFLVELGKLPVVTRAHAHVRTWFRGQARKGLPLVPGVYRTNFPATNESDRLQLEHHLANEFRAQSSGLRAGRDTLAEIYFLQQHYRMPTRLLDWTTNPLAALYFAVSDGSRLEEDGELFLMDAYKLGPDQGVNKDFLGVGSQRNKFFKRALEVIFDWGKPDKFPDFIVPIRPDYIDTRIHSQGGCFTFHVPKRPTLTENENSTLRKLRIVSEKKERIVRELFLLGVDDFSIYGDLEGLSRRLRAAHSIK